MREETKTITIKLCKLIGITLAVYLAMRYILPLVVPFLLAFLVAVLLHPVVEKIENRIQKEHPEKLTERLHSLLCAGIILLFWILFIAILVTILYMTLREGEQAVSCARQWVSSRGGMDGALRYCWNRLLDEMTRITGCSMEQLRGKYAICQQKTGVFLQEKVMPLCSEILWNTAQRIIGMIAVLFVVVVSSLIFLCGYERDTDWLKRTYFGRSAGRILKNIREAGGAYMKAQFLILLVVSAVCVTGLFLLQRPYAILGGIGIGVCDALPFLGTGTILIPMAVFELVQKKYLLAVGMLVLYAVCSFLRNLLEPRLIGGKLGVHPIAVMMSIYVGIMIYGAAGVILGPASALVIRELYRKFT